MLIRPWSTVPEILQSLEGCTLGARFVSRNEESAFFTYAEILRRARTAAGFLQANGLKPGDRVGIILPTSIHFFDAFLGAALAGAIPAALYPPVRLGRLTEYHERTAAMLRRIGARLLVSDRRVGKLLGKAVSEAGTQCFLHAEDFQDGGQWNPVTSEPDQPAFLQFSSGSTREPKAVIVTHRNLLRNLQMMAGALGSLPGVSPEDGGVCWLPLYHDMGLVGCLFNGLHYPATVTYINPEDFIVRPALWLRAISRWKAQVSPAPHFAYRLCVSKIKDAELEGVDLSSWLLALNGAEPIEIDGMRLFTERFSRWGFRPKAMTPVYGLAEAGLAVTFSSHCHPPSIAEFDRDLMSSENLALPGKGRSLPSVGTPLPSVEVQIWDGNGEPMRPGSIGRIVIKGDSITPGYYGDPDSTRNAITDGWLDTGDLGFFHEGELYIAGRAKDLIIIRGRNYAPQEIEHLLMNVPGVRTGCAVAVSHMVEGRGEELLILAEKDSRSDRSDEEIANEIRDRVILGISLTPYLVQMLEPGTLPRTSSGKFRRADALRMYLNQELVPPEKVTSLSLLLELGKSQIAWSRARAKGR